MSEPSEADTPPEDPGDGDTETEDAPARPRRRKKRKKARKKKKQVEAAEDGADEDGLDEDGSDNEADASSAESAVVAPLPGEGTADGDRLRQAHRSFDVGDYRAVRVQVRSLDSSDDPAVAAAARALRMRVDIDPIQVVVLTSCAAVVAAILYVWIL